ncbi:MULTISPECIES: monovalent cation/H(+) antiporter subunit G [Mesorhizobium]|uniref:Cation:proton antiporter n=1 Tax=Mesorhizobium denitrificans TaxID=2294114 RepID=A0A371X913_9HYPH|nr:MULTISPECIES: monovalent cation/H(+) antiporter subunit G [Mesorhizobium]RFC65713.1 cation:proton antiporter [Mesorhizobium denitrificans]
MSDPTALPLWAAILISAFLLIGSGLTLLGAIGLLKFGSFYRRLHAPTLGTTFGAGGILIASIIFSLFSQTRPFLHELLISVFVTVTTPVTLMLLSRAALFRDRTEKNEDVPPFRG